MFVTLNVTQKVSKIVGLLVLVFTWYLCGVHTPGIRGAGQDFAKIGDIGGSTRRI